MDRKKYNECIGDRMRGIKVTPEERRLRFCTSSKICSGKSKTEQEAEKICKESMMNPKPTKSKSPRSSQGKVRLILLTSTNCPPCAGAKKYLQPHIDKGEVEVHDIQKSDFAADMAAKYKIFSVPKLFVVGSDGVPFSEIQIVDNEQMV